MIPKGIPGDPQASPRTPEQPRVPQKAPRNLHSHAGSPATAPAIAFAPPRDASPRGTLGGGRPRKTYRAHPGTTPTSTGHTLEAHHEVFSGSGFRSVPTNSFVLFCDLNLPGTLRCTVQKIYQAHSGQHSENNYQAHSGKFTGHTPENLPGTLRKNYRAQSRKPSENYQAHS